MSATVVAVHRSEAGSFETRVLRIAGMTYIDLVGELDVFGAECLLDTIQDFVLSDPTAATVILDLSQLSFLDLSGVRAIKAAYSELEKSGTEMSIRALGPHLKAESSLGWDLPA